MKTTRIGLTSVTAILGVMLLGGAAAAQTGDARAGARLAESECAGCHAISADMKSKSVDPNAPRFIDVAHMSSTTELSLKVFLRSSHKNMPNIELEPEEIDTVAAYILSLRKK